MSDVGGPELLTSWKTAELREMCFRIGVSKSGNRADLIARLSPPEDHPQDLVAPPLQAVMDPPSAKTRPDPPQLPVAAPTQQTMGNSLDWILRRFRPRFCMVCNFVYADGPSHSSASLHNVRAASEDELKELADRLAMRRSIDIDDFKFTFGRHSGSTIAAVLGGDPQYLEWVASSVPLLRRYPKLASALAAAGLLAEAPPVQETLEIHNCRRRRPRSVAASTNLVPFQQHNCSICGAPDHNAATCAGRDEPIVEARERSRVERRLASLAYTPMEARSANDRATQRARIASERSLMEFMRATPAQLIGMAIEDGLLESLAGMACPFAGCEGVLGDLFTPASINGENIHRDVVHYRCSACSRKVAPTYGNTMFDIGHGATSPSLQVFLYFCCVIGVDATAAVHVVGCCDKTVQKYYDRALRVMEFDALRRQSAVCFGKHSTETRDVEADEKSFRKWREEVRGVVTYYWYPWLLVLQRGSFANVYMESLGVTKSVRLAKVPPMTTGAWAATCDKLFDETSKINLMTDGAPAYKAVDHVGFVEKHAVNHFKKQFVRNCQVIANHVTEARREGKAGCQRAEGAWMHISRFVPHGLHAPTNPAAKAKLDRHIRAGQWHYMMSTANVWLKFCEASQRFRVVRAEVAEGGGGKRPYDNDAPSDFTGGNDRGTVEGHSESEASIQLDDPMSDTEASACSEGENANGDSVAFELGDPGTSSSAAVVLQAPPETSESFMTPPRRCQRKLGASISLPY